MNGSVCIRKNISVYIAYTHFLPQPECLHYHFKHSISGVFKYIWELTNPTTSLTSTNPSSFRTSTDLVSNLISYFALTSELMLAELSCAILLGCILMTQALLNSCCVLDGSGFQQRIQQLLNMCAYRSTRVCK